MPAAPMVFISATSADLRAARDLVAKVLIATGYTPIWQDIAAAEGGNLIDILKSRIAPCQAVVQLVGMRYGFAPPSDVPEFGRVSYTQFEALHAARAGKKVIYIVLPETYPTDPCEPEPPELAALQSAYRERLQSSGHLHLAAANATELENRTYRLRDEFALLRAELKRNQRRAWVAAGVGLALLLSVTVGVWMSHLSAKSYQAEQDARLAEQSKKLDAVISVIDEQRTLITLVIHKASSANGFGDKSTPRERFDRALEDVARERKQPVKELRAMIDLFVEHVESDKNAKPFDQALAAMAKQQYDRAGDLAGQSAAEANSRYADLGRAESRVKAMKETARRDALKAYRLQGAARSNAGRHAEAYAACDSALKLCDEQTDPGEWAVAANNAGLALLHLARFKESEPLIRRALAIDEASAAADRPRIAVRLNNLAQLLQATNRLAEAEPLMRRALALDEASFGPDHPTVSRDLNNLARLLQDTNRPVESEPLIRRALLIDEAAFGPGHPTVAMRLNNLGQLLQETSRPAEAEPILRRALSIFEASHGPDHPYVAVALNNLALLLQALHRPAESEPLMRRALAIDESRLGPAHPRIAIDLNNLALLLQDTNRPAESEPLIRRALAIDEASYGPDHPNVAIRLNTLARLLRAANRLDEAEPLMRRMERILLLFTARTGHPHPRLAALTKNYTILLKELHYSDTDIASTLRALEREAQSAATRPATAPAATEPAAPAPFGRVD